MAFTGIILLFYFILELYTSFLAMCQVGCESPTNDCGCDNMLALLPDVAQLNKMTIGDVKWMY
jgi:hypothetical protein